jgi:hypothetical protein
MIPINPGDAKLVYLGDESSAEKIHQLYRPFDGK